MKKKTLTATLTELASRFTAVKEATGTTPMLVLTPSMHRWVKHHGFDLADYAPGAKVFLSGGIELFLLVTELEPA